MCNAHFNDQCVYQVNFIDQDYQELQELFSPLNNSNSFGVDIFLKVLEFVCYKLNIF